ncbi:MAG: TlpA disulfide reductase family protein [Anaerolineales bacterium]|jgi:thiol-disulfide isomerase/thioredoxin
MTFEKEGPEIRWLGIPRNVFAIAILVLIVGVVVLLPKFKDRQPLQPTPTNAYFSYGSRQIPSVVPAAVEYPAPNLNLIDLKGNSVSLVELQGQVILVNNWAVWCPFCDAEMPQLEAYFQNHKENDFLLVGINVGDSLVDVTEYLQKRSISFTIWVDPKRVTFDAFKNQRLPSSYVIDKNGTVRLAWNGPIGLDLLERFVTPLLEQ